MRIVLEDGSDSAAPDPSLPRLLIRANASGRGRPRLSLRAMIPPNFGEKVTRTR